ncbi:hypothetical protein [Allokutzneria albata]|uniref:Uncharacterized protein n=1 Tax=Allokutzneria albata TaxID=211114 RepID=A0A1G9SZL1_ALLAB|nr:hypothetical protein [Allokutzneria albata]SDM40830.1 hypothetical protein SAMN04489726_1470 [Allokutzneria albata]
MTFLRYESPTPNARGFHVGIFGLANGLVREATLSPEDRAWWRPSNDWFDAAYPDPGKTDPTLFDRSAHPRVAWDERRSAAPGAVLSEDQVQIVVAT